MNQESPVWILNRLFYYKKQEKEKRLARENPNHKISAFLVSTAHPSATEPSAQRRPQGPPAPAAAAAASARASAEWRRTELQRGMAMRIVQKGKVDSEKHGILIYTYDICIYIYYVEIYCVYLYVFVVVCIYIYIYIYNVVCLRMIPQYNMSVLFLCLVVCCLSMYGVPTTWLLILRRIPVWRFHVFDSLAFARHAWMHGCMDVYTVYLYVYTYPYITLAQVRMLVQLNGAMCVCCLASPLRL